MKHQISDEQLAGALSLFRDSVREFQPTGERKPTRSFAGSRIALALLALVMFLIAIVPVYRHRKAEIAKQDEALLRGIESDVSLSVPAPMQRLQLLMVADTVIQSERSK